MAEKKVAVAGRRWKRSLAISADKYEAVSAAVLAVLTTEPVTFTELTRRVAARLRGFEGSVPWYTISVSRQLEVEGHLIRSTKPVRYSLSPRAARRG